MSAIINYRMGKGIQLQKFILSALDATNLHVSRAQREFFLVSFSFLWLLIFPGCVHITQFSPSFSGDLFCPISPCVLVRESVWLEWGQQDSSKQFLLAQILNYMCHIFFLVRQHSQMLRITAQI